MKETKKLIGLMFLQCTSDRLFEKQLCFQVFGFGGSGAGSRNSVEKSQVALDLLK